MSLELEELLARLASTELEVQMLALEQAADAVQKLTAGAISAFATTSAIFPVSERLLQFGAPITKPLEEEFTKLIDARRKTFAAMVLLYLGSKIGVDYLLQELAAGYELAVAISIALSTAGITEAGPLIEARLLQWDLLRDPYGSATLITSLKKLRWNFSPESMECLSRPGLSQNIKLALVWEPPR